MAGLRFTNVRIIVNPAAGKNKAILGPLNDALHPAGVRWDIRITNGPGDAAEAAKQAVADCVDAVGVYGGNGTVAEVAGGIAGSGTPLWILAGGTGNGTLGELGLPRGLKASANMLLDPDSRVAALDLGRLGDRVFLLRAAIGAIAEVDERASREMKDRMGGLAYVSAGFEVMRATRPSRYRVTIDDNVVEKDAVACIIANGAGFGGIGVLAAGVSMTDGVLDVFLYSPDEMAADLRNLRDDPRLLEIRSLPTPPVGSGRRIRVETETPQPTAADGEEAGRTPIDVEILPVKLDVVLPPPRTEKPHPTRPPRTQR